MFYFLNLLQSFLWIFVCVTKNITDGQEIGMMEVVNFVVVINILIKVMITITSEKIEYYYNITQAISFMICFIYNHFRHQVRFLLCCLPWRAVLQPLHHPNHKICLLLLQCDPWSTHGLGDTLPILSTAWNTWVHFPLSPRLRHHTWGPWLGQAALYWGGRFTFIYCYTCSTLSVSPLRSLSSCRYQWVCSEPARLPQWSMWEPWGWLPVYM